MKKILARLCSLFAAVLVSATVLAVDLPDAYVPLEYVTFNGAQHLNTGVAGNDLYGFEFGLDSFGVSGGNWEFYLANQSVASPEFSFAAKNSPSGVLLRLRGGQVLAQNWCFGSGSGIFAVTNNVVTGIANGGTESGAKLKDCDTTAALSTSSAMLSPEVHLV